MPLIPHDASRMELLVVNETLTRIKGKILQGNPSGQVIDQALEEVIEAATTATATTDQSWEP
ncbi:hypothetical protein [Corynebacterium renale]|uniref:hypothetical protein n=1 Tax=Corynebacterium renale TaxID=1724 RepID=UPI000E0449D5|nr:hypothetical protein [Corynebacterium renale]STC97738.1 Uncharacterised protein [Corynebacterium renale]STD70262.1 Uncharacterised protein [Corynebacterium renale]